MADIKLTGKELLSTIQGHDVWHVKYVYEDDSRNTMTFGEYTYNAGTKQLFKLGQTDYVLNLRNIKRFSRDDATKTILIIGRSPYALNFQSMEVNPFQNASFA